MVTELQPSIDHLHTDSPSGYQTESAYMNRARI
jgi:hypothetical protein